MWVCAHQTHSVWVLVLIDFLHSYIGDYLNPFFDMKSDTLSLWFQMRTGIKKKKEKNCRRISIDFARDMRHRVLIWRRRSTCGNLIRLGFFLIVRFQSLFIYSPAPMISSLSLSLPPLDLLTCYFSLSCWMFNWLFIEERSTPHPSIYVRDPRWAFQNLFHMKKKTGKKNKYFDAHPAG